MQNTSSIGTINNFSKISRQKVGMGTVPYMG